MLKEIFKNYKKQAIKLATRVVYHKHYGCNIYSIYDSNGRICNTK